MKKRRFTEEQIIGILKQSEAGMKVVEVCRQNGISDATFYKWREKYGGMTVSEARRLHQLEEENSRLKDWSRCRRSTSLCSRMSSEKTSEAIGQKRCCSFHSGKVQLL